ncbi:hypothetical protein ACHAO5_009291, partial [Verticillium nonalfalfae]
SWPYGQLEPVGLHGGFTQNAGCASATAATVIGSFGPLSALATVTWKGSTTRGKKAITPELNVADGKPVIYEEWAWYSER